MRSNEIRKEISNAAEHERNGPRKQLWFGEGRELPLIEARESLVFGIPSWPFRKKDLLRSVLTHGQCHVYSSGGSNEPS